MKKGDVEIDKLIIWIIVVLGLAVLVLGILFFTKRLDPSNLLKLFRP
ncbi:MAG: hypothetical protein ABIE22_04500 [archaeon]